MSDFTVHFYQNRRHNSPRDIYRDAPALMPRGWDVPVRVVGLHSWVWLVFATETELLQRGKHQGEREAVIPVLTPGGAAASL